MRQNIHPFVTAEVLRNGVKIKWDNDRGFNPDESERRNDLHFSVAETQAARKAAGAD